MNPSGDTSPMVLEQVKFVPRDTTYGAFLTVVSVLGYGSGRTVGYKFGYFPVFQASLLTTLTAACQMLAVWASISTLLSEAREHPDEHFCHNEFADEENDDFYSMSNMDFKNMMSVIGFVYVVRQMAEFQDTLLMTTCYCSLERPVVSFNIFMSITVPKLIADYGITVCGWLFIVRCKDFLELAIDTIGLIFLSDIPRIFYEVFPISLRAGLEGAKPHVAVELPYVTKVCDRCAVFLVVIASFLLVGRMRSMCGKTMGSLLEKGMDEMEWTESFMLYTTMCYFCSSIVTNLIITTIQLVKDMSSSPTQTSRMLDQ